MFLVALTLTTTFATPDKAGCAAPTLLGSIPASGEADVPFDQPLVVLVPDDTCHQGLGLALIDAEDRVRQVPASIETRGSTLLYRGSTVAMPPGAYRLLLRNDDAQTELPFTTVDEPWSAPDLILFSFDSALIGAEPVGEVWTGEVSATTVAPPGTLVHWSGDPQPTHPWFATVGIGAPHTVDLDPWSDTDELCVHVRLESADGALTPWSSRCEAVPPLDTGTPPLDTGTPPLDTGFLWLDTGYYWYDDRSGFTLFACGGCATPTTPPNPLWVWLPVWGLARRRRYRRKRPRE